MKVSLHPHSLAPPRAISAITVEIARTADDVLVLRYEAAGDIASLCLPAPVAYSTRHDELWQTTCFEAFARVQGRAGYQEFNFAPSTAWAAYRFDSYRQWATDQPLPPPHFDVDRLGDRLIVTVVVETAQLEGLPPEKSWQLALTAVIEETDGAKSYWSLAHPPGAPDFHHPDCFVLELPAPEPA